MSENSSPSHSSQTSLSLDPDLLPDNQEEEQSSSISEHITSENSLENDRSLHEMEVNDILSVNNEELASNKKKSLSRTPTDSLNSSYKSSSTNARIILDEILQNVHFKCDNTGDLDNEMNLLGFDDADAKLLLRDFAQSKDAQIRTLEESVSVKDGIIAALNVEIESLKDLASNPSTLTASLNTTQTEYKQLQEECAERLVNYETALQQRDAVIEQLQGTLKSVQKNESNLRSECEQYSKDIQCLQKELAEAAEYIKSGAPSKSRLVDLNFVFNQLKDHLDEELLSTLKNQVNNHVQSKLNEMKSVQRLEIDALNSKHVKEMDETRKYYEKKCADIISEELTSSHSKNISESSSSSNEEDLNLDLDEVGPGGDTLCSPKRSKKARKVWTLNKALKFKGHVITAAGILDKYELENLGESGLAALKLELGAALSEFRRFPNNNGKVEQTDAGVQAQSGDFELAGIVKSYQVQLAQHVAAAKFEMMEGLQQKICALAESNCDDSDFPDQFLEIRRKLSERFTEEIAQLKLEHELELEKIKAKGAPVTDQEHGLDQSNIGQFKDLLIETQKYFSDCEQQLNETFCGETELSLIEDDQVEHFSNLSLTSSTPSSKMRPARNESLRLHLAPNIANFISKLESSNPDVSLQYRNELETCLQRLRMEANAISTLSLKQKQLEENKSARKEPQNNEQKVEDLLDKVRQTARLNEELNEKVLRLEKHISSLEVERAHLEQHLEEAMCKATGLENELAEARLKIGELLEYKEIVSEGYGENNSSFHHAMTSNNKDNNDKESLSLVDLQEKAKSLMSERKVEQNVQQVLEELCKWCDKLIEEAKKERNDFLQQIESADKKLKATQKFLEEQAAEREIERDEAQKLIAQLREQLKARQKEREGFERVNEEVEGFEKQMREMTAMIADGEKRYVEVQDERDEAVDKIRLLRDIIKDLEEQVEVKNKVERELKAILDKQREANDELVVQLEGANRSVHFQQHITQLEEEVCKLRRANEIVGGGDGLMKQIQLQLHELEVTVDKGNREIESLYASQSATNCSSPSEEMSIQDQIRPKTPNTSTLDDCEVPLQQLSRLKEKLFRHSRAEQCALKRIQDLELQLMQAQHEQEELLAERNTWTNERVVLQDRISEQLVLISSLQIRLDEQRIRIEDTQKQANASLELRIYDLESELETYRDRLRSKDGTIKQLNRMIEETRCRLKDREDELSSTPEEHEICAFKEQVQHLRNENELLKLKIASDVQNAHILPSLVDNIIADKNKDIESLRNKLAEAVKQLNLYIAMNTSEKRDEQRGTLAFINLTSPEQMRHAANNSNLDLSCVPEISSIEKLGPPNNFTEDFHPNAVKSNSTELHKSAKRVHFEEDSEKVALSHKVKDLEEQLARNEEIFEKEQENITELKIMVAALKVEISEKEKGIQELIDDSKRKDDMYYELAKEKRDLEKQLDTLDVIRENVEELQKQEGSLKHSLDEAMKLYEDKEQNYNNLLKEFNEFRELKDEELQNLRHNYESRVETLEEREKMLVELQRENSRLKEEFAQTFASTKSQQLQEAVHQKELSEKELQIFKLQSSVDDLKMELCHLQEFLKEKDKIIDIMKEDAEMLRHNLLAIKTKMNESGNVFDLREQLAKERVLNAQLRMVSLPSSLNEIGDRIRQQFDESQLEEISANQSILSSTNFALDQINGLKTALEIESASKKDLENKLRSLESNLTSSSNTIKQLQEVIEQQKKVCNEIQIEDSNLLEQIRVQLEAALDEQKKRKEQLQSEQNSRNLLQVELNSLKTKQIDALNSKEALQNQEELQHDILELRNEIDERAKEIKVLKKAKNYAESGLNYSKELLSLKAKEVEQLQEKIKATDGEVKKLREKLGICKGDLEQRIREIEFSRQLIEDLEHEKSELCARLAIFTLNKEARDEINVNAVIPEDFLKKIKDLGEVVTEHIKENKVMTETILKLTKERNFLQDKLNLKQNDVPGGGALQEETSKAKYFFAKYLRAESFKNALAFQKQYLVGLLVTYQVNPLNEFEPKKRYPKIRPINKFRAAANVSVAVTRMKFMVQRWRTGTRSGAHVTLQQGKFTTHKGGANESREPETHFQVGQPVSRDIFNVPLVFGAVTGAEGGAASNQVLSSRMMTTTTRRMRQTRSPSPIREDLDLNKPWSGSTPPSRDRSHRFQVHSPVVNSEDFRGSEANIHSYIERFEQIQQRLGMVLNDYEEST